MPRGNGKKNHGVNKVRSHIARVKARRGKHSAAIAKARGMRKKDQAHRYWSAGDVDYPK